ncbi:unnamed protein product [Trichobilharzia szidati]|nr:unnamed protein product [Trichobilharzia szidati]
MVSQRTKLNLILLISLCIVNTGEIQLPEFSFPFIIEETGGIHVSFGAVSFTLHDNYSVTVNATGCKWIVDLNRPTTEEKANMGGIRQGYLDCHSWHQPPFEKVILDRLLGNLKR